MKFPAAQGADILANHGADYWTYLPEVSRCTGAKKKYQENLSLSFVCLFVLFLI